MKYILITLFLLVFLFVTRDCWGQGKPKQHTRYDTTKIVTPYVSFDPDTIPVYFKELRVDIISNGDTIVNDQWQRGYVIWDTYKKNMSFGISSGTWGLTSGDYYTDEYVQSPTMPGTFLYADRKTKVTNKVIFS